MRVSARWRAHARELQEQSSGFSAWQIRPLVPAVQGQQVLAPQGAFLTCISPHVSVPAKRTLMTSHDHVKQVKDNHSSMAVLSLTPLHAVHTLVPATASTPMPSALPPSLFPAVPSQQTLTARVNHPFGVPVPHMYLPAAPSGALPLESMPSAMALASLFPSPPFQPTPTTHMSPASFGRGSAANTQVKRLHNI